MKNRVYQFWYSEQHAKHYHRMNQECAVVVRFDDMVYDMRVYVNYVTIDNVRQKYTTCTTDLNKNEPFTDALKTFPDYKLLGTTTGDKLECTKELW